MQTLNRRIKILNYISLAMLTVLLWMVFFYAPPERTMGNMYRFLYFHVGSAWPAAVSFFVALLSGLAYLKTRQNKWDIISMASVEIGLVLFTMTIVSGSIWGRPAWNTWWEWTPRLIGVTIVWLAYVGYFVLRGAIDEPEKRARFAAIYVIAAFPTVVVTFLSIRFFRDLHPVLVGGATEAVESAGAAQGESDFGGGINSTKMGITLTYSFFVFTVIYATWLANRYRLELLRQRVDGMKARMLARLL